MNEKEIQLRMEKSNQLIIISVITFILVAILAGIIFAISLNRPALIGVDLFTVTLVSLLNVLLFSSASFFYGLFASRAAHEDEEKELLANKKGKSTSTFEISEDVRYTAERSFNNYKKYSQGVFAVLGLIVTGLAVYFFFVTWNERLEPIAPENPLIASFLCVVAGFLCMLPAAFFIGQSRDREFRWLRPVGAWLMFTFVLLMISAGIALLYEFDIKSVDEVATKVVLAVICLLGIELLVSFITDFYRPRTTDNERPVFESRLLSLFTEPGGVVRNVADTLDYQFGFKVSKTWIYGFLEKTIAPLVIIWILSLWLFTCIVEISPYELGIKEFFGKRVSDEPLKPGIHFKLPWPISDIKVFPVKKIQQITVEGEPVKDKNGKRKKTEVILWSKAHYKKDYQVLVGIDTEKDNTGEVPVSFLNISFPVQFKIRESELINYAYLHKDAVGTLRDISERTAAKYFASVDLLKVMCVDRGKASEELKKIIQLASDEVDLGVEILSVSLHDAHPPVEEVAASYQDVIGAQEEMKKAILDAYSYTNKVIPEAEGMAQKTINEAEAYEEQQISIPLANSERFTKQLMAYENAPQIYKLKTYMDFLIKDLKDVRKYIVPSDIPSSVYEINLEETQRFDLMDTNLSELESKN